MVSLEFFIDKPSGHTMGLGLTQPLIEVKGKGGRCLGFYVPIVLKSVILNLLGPSEPFQVCNGIAVLYMFNSCPD